MSRLFAMPDIEEPIEQDGVLHFFMTNIWYLDPFIFLFDPPWYDRWSLSRNYDPEIGTSIAALFQYSTSASTNYAQSIITVGPLERPERSDLSDLELAAQLRNSDRLMMLGIMTIEIRTIMHPPRPLTILKPGCSKPILFNDQTD